MSVERQLCAIISPCQHPCENDARSLPTWRSRKQAEDEGASHACGPGGGQTPPRPTVIVPLAQWLEPVPGKSDALSFLFWTPALSHVKLLSSVSLLVHSQPACGINSPILADLTKQQTFKGDEEEREAKGWFGAGFHAPLIRA